MTSSMLTGDRRWAPSRRGGMTVLGKVTVPKPINLPSQKLENHGLDPNVEIVPKGTLSWGSKSSSSSNPWGSSTLSPNAADGTGSPSHLSGRPSSGGSGTRPSTGSSDRAHEPIGNAWSSSSRPSSASGALSSNQTSVASLRPRSAEPRPGSSQLSRFAEPASDNLVAWGSAGTAEKLGVTSSKKDGFSLASGDFPTLGSEKDNAGKNTDSQDHGSHGRPGSSSGGVAPAKDRIGTSLAGDVYVNENVKSGNTDSWRREGNPYNEDGVRPNVDKWQADPPGPQTYPNTGMPPQHYDAWRGPPLNNHPGGVWYRGPPAGPPYGSPVPPGGFPMEPFHFYRPQIPPAALGNPQPVPPPGAGPRAHHPKTGDMYRPPMPDAYMHPGMPIRPGFYPGPVPYEGYYGPPMGYRNSNERDIPFMGVAAGPPAFNRYSSQNAHDSGNSHNRSSGYGPNNKGLATEQVESNHPGDARGPYRVLLKQHDGWDGKDGEQKWEDIHKANAPYIEKGDQPRTSPRKNDWRGDYRKDEVGLKKKFLGEEASFPTSDHEGASSVPVKVKSPKNKGNAKAFDDISMKVAGHAAAATSEIPAAPRDSSLFQKIEGLNAKARTSDGRHDVLSVSSREEQKNKSQVSATGSVHFGRNHATKINNTAACEVGVTTGDKGIESTAASGIVSRRSIHGMHGTTDHRGKGRFNAQEVDGWRKKSSGADSASSVSAAAHSESSNIQVQYQIPEDTSEKSGSYSQGKDGGESTPPMLDTGDSQAQRVKMREQAKQRVKQREKEEEERARDQKAKALAKLEDLDRRTQAVNGLTHKSEVSCGIQNKQDEYQSLAESTMVASKSGTSSSVLVCNSNVAQISYSGTSRVERSTVSSNEPLIERPKNDRNEPLGMHKINESLTGKHDGNDADAVHCNNTSQVFVDGSAVKLKRVGYKQKQNTLSEKNTTEKLITAGATDALKGYTDVTANGASSNEVVANETAASCESSLPVNPNVVTESSMHQRKRNNRGGKKLKMEEASSATTAALPSVASTNVKNTSGLSGEVKATESTLDPISVSSLTESKDANQSSEQRLSSPNEENHGRANNQWKSQHSRRMPRSGQTSKTGEKFHTSDAVIWAPVRTQNKAEVTGEASQKSVVEVSSVKSDHQVQNNSRNKRAEMERYIPKPVAKEMAQQGSNQQHLMVPSVDQTTSNEIVGRTDTGSLGLENTEHARFASGKAGVAMESRNGDSRQNKQGKVHGSWRQRTSTESTVVQSLQDGQSSNASRNLQKSIEHQQPQKPDVSSGKEQPKYSDNWGISDGWNMPEIPDSAVPHTVPVVKDQGATARGKRHQFKGHKGTGSNLDHDHKKINSGDTDKIHVPSPVPVPEMSHTEVLSASKENRAFGDRSTSHWQPKSQAFSASNQRGSRPNSGQNVGADVVRVNRKDSIPQVGLPPPTQPEKETNDGVAQAHRGQSASQTEVEETQYFGHQESKRERKMTSVKGRPHSPYQGPDSMVETTPQSNMDIQHEQHTSSGFRRNGNQNSRFGRGNESRGDWSSSGQDNRQQNQPINRERQRQNSHYEYQPVGPYNNNRGNNYEGAKDGPNYASGRYRERGQPHPRRGGGNFNGRPSGTVRADAYD
ncbi:hypothetical protein Ddye_002292 [Dipteronia dyeriana]|uniref:BAT2 N-terminal domain-containing protein n=1 Tax=Dipteronia dyeriana TaxID=168575 RepID=A0AAE0CUV7_9ROSI|nr:hypothetical protein Ddye_002292 [Dipteronia dyeriana]